MSLEPEQADEIDHALKDIVTFRFFVKHAKSPEWLKWIEGKPIFRVLFQSHERNHETLTKLAKWLGKQNSDNNEDRNEDFDLGRADKIKKLLAKWFTEKFVREHSDAALAVIQRLGLDLSATLWHEIAKELTYPDSLPDSEILGKWMAVLLHSPFPKHQIHLFDYLLQRCRYPEDRTVILKLFEYLTRPRIELKRPLSFPLKTNQQKVDAAIVCEGEHFTLKESWNAIVKPYLSEFAKYFFTIFKNHITQAHLLLRCSGQANEGWDSISFSRSAIEPHKQDKYPNTFDIVIDGMRDLIEWLLEYNAVHAEAVIKEWAASGIPLLKRLAIHSMAENPHRTPEEKFSWIIDLNWLYKVGLKHEIFRLIEKAYPQSGDKARQLFLRHVQQGPDSEFAEELEKDTIEYEIYNLLYWLQRVAPNCRFAQSAFETAQKNNPEFGPREKYTDFDVSYSGMFKPQSPISVEEILKKEPADEQFINWLLTYITPTNRRETREALLENLSMAITQSFDWSWKLVTCLLNKQQWQTDLWKSIFRGWVDSTLREDQWSEIFDLLATQKEIYHFADRIAALLEKGIQKSENAIPLDCLEKAEQVADQLWDVFNKDSGEQDRGNHDWLTIAINHAAGRIVEFWLHALSKIAGLHNSLKLLQ